MASRNPVLPGAAFGALAALAFAAGPPAHAHGLFGSKPAAKPTAPTAAKDPKATAADAAPQKATPAARAAAERLEPLARAAFWAHEADLDPTDVQAGVRLSAALRAIGRFGEAAQAADKALVVAPADEEALLEAGRARLAADQGFYAVGFLQKAQAAAPRDWRPLSLLGVAYGQTKRLGESQAAYDQALRLSPGNPAVLSNLAMTLAASGQTAQAETLLRQAAASPQATATERQNLALVLGMEGRMGEAEGLIRQDLPPEQADANLAYLQAANTPRRH